MTDSKRCGTLLVTSDEAAGTFNFGNMLRHKLTAASIWLNNNYGADDPAPKKTEGIVKRAINVKINAGRLAGTSYTVGGQKAGRFWSDVPVRRKKPVKRIVVSSWTKIYKVSAIVFCIFMVWVAIWDCNRTKNANVSPIAIVAEVAEASAPRDIVSRDFRSADMPAEEPDLFDKYFGDKADIARAICKAENRSENPNAVNRNKNGSIDQGLCQINTINVDKYVEENIFDPEVNIKTAKKIYDSQGWGAWTAFNNGSWKNETN